MSSSIAESFWNWSRAEKTASIISLAFLTALLLFVAYRYATLEEKATPPPQEILHEQSAEKIVK